MWGFAPSSSVAGHTSGAGLARPRLVRTHDTRRRIGPYRDDRIMHPPSLPTLRPAGGPTLRARQATRRWDGGTITPQPLGYPGVCPGAPRAPGIGVGTDRRRSDATRLAPSGSPAARRYRRRATAYQGTRAQGGRRGVARARASGRSPGVPPHKRATTGPPPLGVTPRYGARASRRPGVPPAGCNAALRRPGQSEAGGPPAGCNAALQRPGPPGRNRPPPWACHPGRHPGPIARRAPAAPSPPARRPPGYASGGPAVDSGGGRRSPNRGRLASSTYITGTQIGCRNCPDPARRFWLWRWENPPRTCATPIVIHPFPVGVSPPGARHPTRGLSVGRWRPRCASWLSRRLIA